MANEINPQELQSALSSIVKAMGETAQMIRYPTLREICYTAAKKHLANAEKSIDKLIKTE